MKDEPTYKTDGTEKPRILIYCQHVLGMGHLIRSMAIARALKNCTVVFINGEIAFRPGGSTVGQRRQPATDQL